jgi:hypothetical protein
MSLLSTFTRAANTRLENYDCDNNEVDDTNGMTENSGTELPPLKMLVSTHSEEGDSSSNDSSSEQPVPSVSARAGASTPQHKLTRRQSLDDAGPVSFQTGRRRTFILVFDTYLENAYPFVLQILQLVIDRIEDEVEAHAYDDLVPLDVQLALEDKVFGWTHLTSAIIGHTFFTCGSYWLTFQWVTIVFDYMAITDDAVWAVWLRAFLCVWAALTTFRMVRRRRHVWFRSAYGSKSYYDDADRRRKQVAETDRTTALGRFVQSFRHRRVMSKLRRAETQFAKKHIRHHKELLKHRRTSSIDSDSEAETVNPTSERQNLLDRRGGDIGYDSSGSDESNTRSTSGYERVIPAGTPLIKKHRRPSFNTKPTSRMHSYANDEILMEEPILNIPYAHGGFFGAAPFLLSNPHWISLLRHLMPDVYVEISRRVAINPPSRLIHWAENNPIVAAYGAAHALDESSGMNDSSPAQFPNLEWDVFLDPALVRRVQRVLDQQAEFRTQKPTSDRSKEQSAVIDAYYQQELKRRSEQLVDKMLIAHGNTLQLAIEQLGVFKDFNYSRVKRTRRTLGGGIYARSWMAVFAEALKLGICYEDENGEPPSPSKPDVGSSKKKISSLFALAESTCPDTSIEESIRIVEKVTRSKRPFGLILDIKSRHVPHHIWAIVVDRLRIAGVRVEGVGSFCIDEIRGLSRFSTIGPIPGMIFCHSAGDLQKACHEGKIQKGDKVFFNAGCLLRSNMPSLWSGLLSSFDPRHVKESYRIEAFGLPRGIPADFGSCLQDYKDQYDLHIGVYCQEFAIDEAAVQMLVSLVNRDSHLYDLGFSWGGINGITIKGIAPGRFTQTDGYWNQRHIGRSWAYDMYPSPLVPSMAIAASATSVSTDSRQ